MSDYLGRHPVKITKVIDELFEEIKNGWTEEKGDILIRLIKEKQKGVEWVDDDYRVVQEVDADYFLGDK